ncbi:hypothetical protein [Lysinibacillus fusiformis]|uniref:Uncharacterized protein n=1 Tax=Lysinibacillus fusiformis TaxID=28031 RepID=A0A1E4R4R4_9BACI|nr:hypothetical protein [Lysinibacillus fusiformis]ODV55454.1 hypothetical protein BG258_05820 [Lysinibacillus fusiformis]
MDKLIKNIKKNKWVYLLLAIPGVPISINYFLLTWKFPGVKGNYDDWLGFLSNYSGGIIGGIVAFVVANHQVKKQMEEQIKNEEEVKYINQLPSVINLIFELEEMKTSIINAHKMRNVLQENGCTLSQQINARYDIKKINMKSWEEVSNIQDVDFQKSLITLRNEYCKIAEILTSSIEDIKDKIREIGENNEKKNIGTLYHQIEILKADKDWAWKELTSKDYISIIDDSIYLSNIIVECIDEMMTKRHLIRDKQ